MRGGRVICDLRSDHNLDHLQVWTTWEIWTLWYIKARVSDEKARKSTKKEAKNRCRAVWDVEAGSSSLPTPTRDTDMIAYCDHIGNIFTEHT